jgi:hypothetical protein
MDGKDTGHVESVIRQFAWIDSKAQSRQSEPGRSLIRARRSVSVPTVPRTQGRIVVTSTHILEVLI